jgi:hypothetical protein
MYIKIRKVFSYEPVLLRWAMWPMGLLLIFHILHCVMNESKHCECKKVIKSRKCGCLVLFKNEFILLYHLQIWHVYTACVSQCSELVTSDIGAHRDDEQEIVTGSQSFMKLLFLLLLQLYWLKFTRVLWNYIYLNWNKTLFRYFGIFSFPLSKIGNIALSQNFFFL